VSIPRYTTNEQSIDDLYDKWKKNNKIDLTIDIQRDEVWLAADETYWIDSLLRGFHNTDKILFNFKNNTNRVLNGKQKLITTFDFIDGKLVIRGLKKHGPIPLDNGNYIEINSCVFKDLPKELRNRILRANLDVTTYEGLTRRQEAELFARTNTTGKRLNPAEIRNASDFPVSRSILIKLSKHPIFKELKGSWVDRFGDRDVSQRLVMLIDKGFCGLTTQSLNNYYYEVLDTMSEDDNVIKKAINTMDYVNQALRGRFITIAKGEFHLITYSAYILRTFFSTLSPKDFGDTYIRFIGYIASLLSEDKEQMTESDLRSREDAKLYKKQYLRRLDKLSIEEGCNYLISFIKHDCNLKKKDPQRYFSDEQKLAIYHKCNGRCRGCGDKLSLFEAECDHIESHADGGRTNLANGQILCKDCHKYKTKYGKLPVYNIGEKVDYNIGQLGQISMASLT